MGRVQVDTTGLKKILSEYVGPSLIDEALDDVRHFIGDNVEITVHVEKKWSEADFRMIPGDVITINYGFDIGLLISRDPTDIAIPKSPSKVYYEDVFGKTKSLRRRIKEVLFPWTGDRT